MSCTPTRSSPRTPDGSLPMACPAASTNCARWRSLPGSPAVLRFAAAAARPIPRRQYRCRHSGHRSTVTSARPTATARRPRRRRRSCAEQPGNSASKEQRRDRRPRCRQRRQQGLTESAWAAPSTSPCRCPRGPACPTLRANWSATVPPTLRPAGTWPRASARPPAGASPSPATTAKPSRTLAPATRPALPGLPGRPGHPVGHRTQRKMQHLETAPCSHARRSASYRPPPSLAHLIRIRQRTCSFPGCRRPASRCDLDHVIPYDRGGATCECNMAPLCRRHHQAKQAPRWRLDQPEPGNMTWQLPSGRTYQTAGEVYVFF